MKVTSTLTLLLFMATAPYGVAAGGLQFPDWAGGAANNEPLPVEEAFVLRSKVTAPGMVELFWEIKDGYYLYRDKSNVIIQPPHELTAEPQWPRATTIEDPQFGKVDIYRQQLALNLQLQKENSGAIPAVQVRYQGCKEDSVCYPPVTTTLSLAGLWGVGDAAAATPDYSGGGNNQATASNMLWLVISIAFITGLGLALTPCVFPLIPLVSGYLVGTAAKSSKLRAVALTSIYVLAMASVYGVVGAAAAAIEFNIQAASQAPIFVTIFAIFLAFMGFAMLGMFQLQMPMFMRNWLDAAGRKQQTGSIKGAASLGVVSAFMVGPCTAPPLLAALAFANVSQQPALAGTAMFFMGLGLGVPLLALGLSAGTLLPKAGVWMQTIKNIFGVGLLALALWAAQRLLPDPAVMLLWALLLITVAVSLGALEPLQNPSVWNRTAKGLGLLMLLHSAALVIGAAQGNRDLLRPLNTVSTASVQTTHLQFTKVNNIEELRTHIAAAQEPVMLDYRADWCTVCLQLENETFTDARVQAALRGTKLLQVDVTDYDNNSRELLREYSLHGPPAILFFSGDMELQQARVYEFMDAESFVQHIQFATAL